MSREGEYFVSRPLTALLMSVLLGLGATGCGGAGRASGTSAASSATSTQRFIITTSTIPPGQRLRGDGDSDNPGDIDGNGDIDTEDGDADAPVPNSYRMPDEDDRPIFAYGHHPSAGEGRAIASVVKRYYADASAGDGAGACALLVPSIAGSVSEDYGQKAGSRPQGGETCQAVLSALFRSSREQLAEPITLVTVGVEGHDAQVVIGSRKMRASSLQLTRRGGSWKLQQLLGQVLP